MNDPRFMNHARATAEGLAAESAQFAPWFHNLHLPDGTETAPEHPLGDFPTVMWRQIAGELPEDLTGWTALDVGCNSGFYAIELARRGARVTGIDSDPHFLRQAAWAVAQFDFADRIQLRQAHVYELAHERQRYDLVLFMGVFYHLRYPLLALDILAGATGQLMVFQSLSLPGEEVETAPADQDFDDRSAMIRPGWPKMAFVENALAGDPTNWWVPNRAGVEAMLRSTGLRVLKRPHPEVYICELDAERQKQPRRDWDLAELRAATGQRPIKN